MPHRVFNGANPQPEPSAPVCPRPLLFEQPLHVIAEIAAYIAWE